MIDYRDELNDVLWNRFYRILHCNLTQDTYGIVKDEDFEAGDCEEPFSCWLETLTHRVHILEPDMDKLKKIRRIEYLRQYFKENDMPLYVRFWTKKEDHYEPIVLEMEKAARYRDDDQRVFLTMKRSMGEIRVDMPEQTILRKMKRLYSVLSYVDFQNDFLHVYKRDDVNEGGVETEYIYSKRILEYIGLNVREKDKDRMTELTKSSYVMERLKKDEFFQIDYEGIAGDYYRMVFIRVKDDGSSAVLCEASRTTEHENEIARIEAEDNYKVLRKIIKSGMWNLEIDENGKWLAVTWSDEFRRMLGFTDEHDFPNTVEAWSSRLHPDDWSTAYDMVDKVIMDNTGKIIYDVEYRIQTKTKKWRWIRAMGDVIRTPDGKPVRFYGVFLDITDQKERAQLEQERLEAMQKARNASEEMTTIYATLGSASWNMEFDEHYQCMNVYWSSNLKQMFGYEGKDPSEEPFKGIRKLVHPEDLEKSDQIFWAAVKDRTGKTPYDIEFRLRTLKDGYRWFRSAGRATRRKDGTPIIFYGVVMDIEQQKQMNNDLRNALSEAQYANSSKTAFLNNMSHDIRTPLNAIIGFVNLAERHLQEPQVIREYLDKIKVSGNHLLSLINDVLDMSRIESGRVYIEEKEASLLEIMDDLVSMIQLDAEHKKIELRVETIDITKPWVLVDALRLKQVLMNLLSNAIKFTPEGGHIAFKLMQLYEDSSDYVSVAFHVIDDGIGMSEQFAKHAFEPFERERTATVSGIQGTGLGLTIAKNIAQMLGGTIEFHSKQGKGTHFALAFRFKECAPEERAEQFEKQKYEFSGKRLLLVEDNELNREIAIEILSEAGFVVETAADGDIAVEIMKSERAKEFDGILMDIQMPRMDGYEATRLIRDIEGMQNKPIIAMTANAFAEDRQKAINCGMNGYIAKPIDVETLFKILKECL
ncbi:hybrid sensor histidine kinase/response regulator [Eubacterium oxidoreducens]|uniref:Stage 0 sporulation protein A homolog n=1 Tax=Eubacterium oxidoreducens TaxID=1732 RepID=A0A1G6AG33_EUBOX|nr:hybrid sensor histidine kinase/response regulator [Eubacterium oxidoreducens]SDB07053.1 PAS domain S-box-containing protein [Eubacterium oxidoreducens]